MCWELIYHILYTSKLLFIKYNVDNEEITLFQDNDLYS